MKKAILVFILLTGAASAFTALPAIGYSASSGFILGGYLLFPLSAEGDQFSIDTYYGTAGVIKFQPGLVKKFDSGLFSSPFWPMLSLTVETKASILLMSHTMSTGIPMGKLGQS